MNWKCLGFQAKDKFKFPFKVYVLNLVEPLYSELTFDEDTDEELLDTYSRVIAVKWACKYGLSNCVESAANVYDEWIASDGLNGEMWVFGFNRKGFPNSTFRSFK